MDCLNDSKLSQQQNKSQYGSNYLTYNICIHIPPKSMKYLSLNEPWSTNISTEQKKTNTGTQKTPPQLLVLQRLTYVRPHLISQNPTLFSTGKSPAFVNVVRVVVSLTRGVECQSLAEEDDVPRCPGGRKGEKVYTQHKHRCYPPLKLT